MAVTVIKLAWCCLLAAVIVAAMLFPVVGGAGVMSNRASDVVANGSAQLVEGEVPAVTTMVDAKGNVIAWLYSQRRFEVAGDQIADTMKLAIVSIEDKRFAEHNGVDWKGTLTGLTGYMSGDDDTRGGSTIEQQYVKNYQLLVISQTDAEKRAAIALRNLASDADGWVNAYLGALEQVGILRPVDQAPPIRQNTKVMSLMSTLATGILLGPVGDQIRTTGDLVEFFAKIKTWYGDTPKTLAAIDHYEHRESNCLDGEIPVPALPKYADYNLNLSHPTYFETFNIFVPYVGFNKDGASAATIALPDYASVAASNQLTALDFSRLYAQAISDGQLASISGPQGYGVDQFLPVGQALPYTVKFENPSAASSSVTEIRVASTLDPSLDPTTFRLGDIKLGDVTIHIPSGRALFQGDFDLRNSKGYILRVSAGIDPTTHTASWVFQAIDPDTGEVLQDATRGLLLPNAADGRGTGQLGYTVQPKADLPSGTQISAQAVVRFNAIAPQETQKLTQTLDTQAPVTTLTAAPVTAGGSGTHWNWPRMPAAHSLARGNSSRSSVCMRPRLTRMPMSAPW